MSGLVLGRRPNESIDIGADIRITVVSIEGQQCRIRIEAPPNIKILRSELPVHPEKSHGR